MGTDEELWSDVGNFSRANTSSEIAARIIGLIESGRLLPGATLPPERGLAAQLGVSRTTLRQAMHELAMKGLVERRQGSGTVVLGSAPRAQLLASELRQAYRDAYEAVDFRNVYEPEMAAMAAERALPSDIERLRELCAYSPDEATAEHSVELDLAFHAAIAAATQNRLLIALNDTASGLILDLRRASHATSENRRSSLEGHRRIFGAIVSGDSAESARLMRSHIAAVTAESVRAPSRRLR